jgi:hypothetical protein
MVAESLRDMAANIVAYLNDEILVDEKVSLVDLLDALATFGYTMVEDPGTADASFTYMEELT